MMPNSEATTIEWLVSGKECWSRTLYLWDYVNSVVEDPYKVGVVDRGIEYSGDKAWMSYTIGYWHSRVEYNTLNEATVLAEVRCWGGKVESARQLDEQRRIYID